MNLEEILYFTDPGGTRCSELEMYDEYEYEARLIENKKQSLGLTFEQALIETFKETFKETLTTNQVTKISELYYAN